MALKATQSSVRLFSALDAEDWFPGGELLLGPALLAEGLANAFRRGVVKAGSDAARRVVERVVIGGRNLLKGLTESLTTDNTDRWYGRMAKGIAAVTTAAAAGLLGRRDFSRASLTDLADRVSTQIGYLIDFRQAVASGEVSAAMVLYRAGLYADSAWGSAWAILMAEMVRRGLTMARRILGVADHCEQCIALAAKGWTPFHKLVPIGEARCHVRCHCHLLFR